MAWHLPRDKSPPEATMVRLLTHICVTLPQWLNLRGATTKFYWFALVVKSYLMISKYFNFYFLLNYKYQVLPFSVLCKKLCKCSDDERWVLLFIYRHTCMLSLLLFSICDQSPRQLTLSDASPLISRGLLTPYIYNDMDQHWLRFDVWRIFPHKNSQAITWVDIK